MLLSICFGLYRSFFISSFPIHVQNELSAILRFGAEELFKEDKNEEEAKKKLENMDIDEVLERGEKVESKETKEEGESELLSAFKVGSMSDILDCLFLLTSLNL